MSDSFSKTSAKYEDFSLVSGGLIYRLTTFSKKNRDPIKGLRRRTIILTAVAWIPLFAIILISSYFDKDQIVIHFLKDFEIQLRLLIVIPFLVLIEKVVNTSFVNYVKTSDDLIINEEQARYNDLVIKINNLSNLYFPEIFTLILIYVFLFYQLSIGSLGEFQKDYLFNADSKNLTIAGYYFFFISFPVFQLLLSRWVWRWIIWVYSIIKISKFNFKIEAVNADGMGGLYYLNTVPLTFSLIFLCFSIMIASSFGYDIINEGQSLKSFSLDILFFIIGIPCVVYFPLLFFMPLMMRVKKEGIVKMGGLVARHNSEYMNKWTNGDLPKDEALLGNVDHSSLSDINGGYAPVISMSVVPISKSIFLSSCIILALPFVPLVFTYYSLFDLIKLLLDQAF